MTDTSLEALWQHVLRHWDEEAAHRAFLGQAQATQQLPAAAARYRALSAEAERGPMARRQLEAVTRLALLGLELSRSRPPPPRRQAALWLPVIVLVLAMVVLAVYLKLLQPGAGP